MVKIHPSVPDQFSGVVDTGADPDQDAEALEHALVVDLPGIPDISRTNACRAAGGSPQTKMAKLWSRRWLTTGSTYLVLLWAGALRGKGSTLRDMR